MGATDPGGEGGPRIVRTKRPTPWNQGGDAGPPGVKTQTSGTFAVVALCVTMLIMCAIGGFVAVQIWGK